MSFRLLIIFIVCLLASAVVVRSSTKDQDIHVIKGFLRIPELLTIAAGQDGGYALEIVAVLIAENDGFRWSEETKMVLQSAANGTEIIYKCHENAQISSFSQLEGCEQMSSSLHLAPSISGKLPYVDVADLKFTFGEKKVEVKNVEETPNDTCAFVSPAVSVMNCKKIEGDLVPDEKTKEVDGNLKEITGCLIMKKTVMESYEFLNKVEKTGKCRWWSGETEITENSCIPYNIRRKVVGELQKTLEKGENNKGCNECVGGVKKGEKCHVVIEDLKVDGKATEETKKQLGEVREVYGRIVVKDTTMESISFAKLEKVETDSKEPAIEISGNKNLTKLELPSLKNTTTNGKVKVKISENPKLEKTPTTGTSSNSTVFLSSIYRPIHSEIKVFRRKTADCEAVFLLIFFFLATNCKGRFLSGMTSRLLFFLSALPLASCYDSFPAAEGGCFLFIFISMTVFLALHVCGALSGRGEREMEAVFFRDYVEIGQYRVHYLVSQNHTEEDIRLLEPSLGRTLRRVSQRFLFNLTRSAIPTDDVDGNDVAGRPDEGRNGPDNGNGEGRRRRSGAPRAIQAPSDASRGRREYRATRLAEEGRRRDCRPILGYVKATDGGKLRAFFKPHGITTKLVSSSKELPTGWKIYQKCVVLHGKYATTVMLNKLVAERNGNRTVGNIVCLFQSEEDVQDCHFKFFQLTPGVHPPTFGDERWILLCTTPIQKQHVATQEELEMIVGPLNSVFPAWSHLPLDSWSQIFSSLYNMTIDLEGDETGSGEDEDDVGDGNPFSDNGLDLWEEGEAQQIQGRSRVVDGQGPADLPHHPRVAAPLVPAPPAAAQQQRDALPHVAAPLVPAPPAAAQLQRDALPDVANGPLDDGAVPIVAIN